jgi:hypothetical protein
MARLIETGKNTKKAIFFPDFADKPIVTQDIA